MCGRYAIALRLAQVRQLLEDDDMPVDEAPDDNDGDEAGGNNYASGVPRQSYNFAPGYHGIVYRADVPDWGAGPRRNRTAAHDRGGAASGDGDEGGDGGDRHSGGAEKSSGRRRRDGGRTRYKLQSMKWGLVPFWTKRGPDYGSVLKTINCRDDSLAQAGGMWASMKARKRCIVVAQGFYEWLKKDGGREKIPHFVKRKDGKLMCFAGLWDVVQYEGDDEGWKNYTYTIITTESNKQLSFLHDRMPVILENGSDALRTWLDPGRHEWSAELQALLRPFEGELDVYPVSKEVGKVGNNSPSFIIPLDSKENKNNIANFFAAAAAKKGGGSAKKEVQSSFFVAKKREEEQPEIRIKNDEGFVEDDSVVKLEDGGKELSAGQGKTITGVKRQAVDDDEAAKKGPLKKRAHTTKVNTTKSHTSPAKGGGRPKISATSNGTKSPAKPKQAGTQKITKFFANSS
ncbi:hypothetical protein DL770_007105 [Monosporascus sp. CRB-9-2]|nr:hypothetical protein DL770_007105 [Monosporascus sp. CRB-9-2]